MRENCGTIWEVLNRILDGNEEEDSEDSSGYVSEEVGPHCDSLCWKSYFYP
jgi:hypothetical protein